MLLNEAQQKVVDFVDGPCICLSTAGSGKTRCIIERIKKLLECGVSNKNILCITFTNKAANEMKKRIGDNDIYISTFHAFCARQLRINASLLGYGKNFTIYDEDAQKVLMKQIVESAGFTTKELDPRILISMVENKRNKLIKDETFAAEQHSNLCFEYFKQLKANNAIDFSGLIEEMIRLLNTYPNIAKAYSERYKFVLVDEFQDTNLAQLELIKLLTTVNKNVMVVGDIDQSIYGWRGANYHNVKLFREHFNAPTLKLEQNYRSTAQILELAGNLITHNKDRENVSLISDRGDGPTPQIIEANDDRDEVQKIATILQDHYYNDDIPWKDMAILYRINALSVGFEQVFRERGIPYILIGSFGFFDRREVKTALSYLKFLTNNDDIIAFDFLINYPSRGVGAATANKLTQLAKERKISLYELCKDTFGIKGIKESVSLALLKIYNVLSEANQEQSITQLAIKIFEESGFLDAIKRDDNSKSEHREANIEQLINIIAQYEKTNKNKNLVSFLQDISLSTEEDEKEDDNKVKLMTVHSAKGLEFPVICIAGCEEEIIPHKLALENGEVAEERRVMYVAITRAKTKLYLSYANSRASRGSYTSTAPSRFLYEAGLI